MPVEYNRRDEEETTKKRRMIKKLCVSKSCVVSYKW